MCCNAKTVTGPSGSDYQTSIGIAFFICPDKKPGQDRHLDTAGTPGRSLNMPTPTLRCTGKAKAKVAVPVARGVVVTICRPAVPGVVVPATAPVHMVLAAVYDARPRMAT